MSLDSQSAARDRERYRRDKKNNANFWRALSYLRPYRPMVAVSIVCAVFVGLAMTSGLATMLRPSVEQRIVWLSRDMQVTIVADRTRTA